MEELLSRAENLYKEQFGGKPEVSVFAPGRVNLIGREIQEWHCNDVIST